jgi:hypothetical protein
MDTKERQTLRQELVGAGYAWDMIDNWQAKTTLYWHMDKLNASGDMRIQLLMIVNAGIA